MDNQTKNYKYDLFDTTKEIIYEQELPHVLCKHIKDGLYNCKHCHRHMVHYKNDYIANVLFCEKKEDSKCLLD